MKQAARLYFFNQVCSLQIFKSSAKSVEGLMAHKVVRKTKNVQ